MLKKTKSHNSKLHNKSLPTELIDINKYFFEPNGMISTKDPILDKENRKYSAYSLIVNNKKILFRVAKITPTKIGQFVTLWKKPHKEIIPFDEFDDIDFVIISVKKDNDFGIFIFPKSIMIKYKIFSQNDIDGKELSEFIHHGTFQRMKKQ